MAEDPRPLSKVTIMPFPGMFSDRNPHVSPAIAVDGQNARTFTGKLEPRKGCYPITFGNESTAPTGSQATIAVFSAIMDQRGDAVFWVGGDGKMNVGVGGLSN